MMVFAILVETTRPIFVLRSDFLLSAITRAVLVGVIAYFLAVAVFFCAFFSVLLSALASALPSAGFFAALATTGWPLPFACRTRSRAIVLMRAMSLRKPRTFLRLSVC